MYKSNAAQLSLLGLCMCSGDCVWRHSALCLDFDALVVLVCLWVGRGYLSPIR